MIAKPTVLVLGAGASRQYGFPTGTELKRIVVDSIRPNPADSPWSQAFTEAGMSYDDCVRFRSQLNQSGKASVDAFLEHRREFLDIGKTAMALALIPRENQDTLFPLPGTEDNTVGCCWYQHLFGRLTEGIGVDVNEFVENQLSVVTFNYDRSLEQFLFTALTNSYDITADNCPLLLKSIPIIHVHGTLGFLPWQGRPPQESRSYEPKATAETVRIAASHISVIFEAGTRLAEFERARQELAKAHRVLFLGFGYHPDNLRRLGFGLKRLPAGCWGSSHGLGMKERRSIKEKYRIAVFDDHNEILDFLKNHTYLD